MDWFANKGQVIQLALQLVALVFTSRDAFTNMRTNNFFSIGAVVFYLLVASVLVSLWLVIPDLTNVAPRDWWVLGTVFAGSLAFLVYAGMRNREQRSLSPIPSLGNTAGLQKPNPSGQGNRILGPPSRDPVSHRQVVEGELVVQVFVYSGDRKWYPQLPQTVEWKGPCTFGYEDSPAGNSYRIAAVVGGQPLPMGIGVEDLPSGEARSQEVPVSRK